MDTVLLRSPKLKPGDLVRLVSPASYPPESDIGTNIKMLESWGLRCDTGQHVNGDTDQYALPLGSLATLDSHEGILTIEPVVC